MAVLGKIQLTRWMNLRHNVLSEGIQIQSLHTLGFNLWNILAEAKLHRQKQFSGFQGWQVGEGVGHKEAGGFGSDDGTLLCHDCASGYMTL